MTDASEGIDLAELERLAKAANCWGRWAIWPDLKEGGFVHVGNADGVIPEGEIATPEGVEPNPIAKCYTPEIAEFIAATGPDTVLDLVARVREAEARIEKVVRLRDRMERQRDDIDESVRLSTILVDLNAALTEGDEQ